MDRLTLCLIRANRRTEAIAAADAYFVELPGAADNALAKAIVARINKARSK